MYIEFDAKVSQIAGGAGGMEVTAPAASTVQAALFQVAQAFPALHLFNCEGEMRSILRVKKNDQPAALTDTITETDTLRLGVGG